MAVAPNQHFIYVTDPVTSKVAGYSISSSTGALSPITGSPFSIGKVPDGVVIDPTGRFLYVNCTTAFVVGFSIDSQTGALQPMAGSPFAIPGTSSAFAAAIDPQGKFLYTGDNVTGKVGGFSINSTSGVLTPITGSPFPGGANLAWVGVHPSGKFLYVDDFGFGAGSTFGYTINASTGALVRIPGQVATSQAPHAGVFYPNGQFFYVTGEYTNGVLAYSVDPNSGQLSLVSGSPFPAGFFPVSLAIDSTSKFLFAPNTSNSNVSGYAVNSSTGALTAIPGSPFLTGSNPSWVGIATGGAVPVTISPNQGGNAGNVTVQVTGSGFQAGAGVKLTGLGSDILGANTIVPNSFFLTTTFDLTGAAVGPRNVLVTNPDNTTASITDGFTVQQGGSPQLSISAIGRNTFRAGNELTLYLAAANQGSVDAMLPSVQLAGIPVNSSSILTVKSIQPVGLFKTMTAARLHVQALTSSTGSDYSLDFSVVDPEGTIVSPTVWTSSNGTQRFGFSPLRIPPGDVFLMGITFLLSDVPGGQFIGSAMISAPLVNSGSGTLSKCLVSLGKNTFNQIPLAGCVTSMINHFSSEAKAIYEFLDNVGDTGGTVLDLGQLVASIVKNGFQLVAGDCGLSAGQAATQASLAVDAFEAAMSLTSSVVDCYDFLNGDYAQSLKVKQVSALDPNDKIGSAGVGALQFVSGVIPLPYSIYFDNQPTATAPAQLVTIIDSLNTNLDLSTLTLGPITFPNQVITPPSIPLSVSPFTTTVDLRPTTNLLVKVSASLNASTATLTQTFQSLDPATNQPPTDPLAGFLPPGAEGSVFFTISPKSSVATGTVIQNTATVIFDLNAPISTPTWSNTLDNTPPTSHVAALAGTQSSLSFAVQWSGTDVGAGVQDYTVYVSDNGGAFAPWLINTPATQSSYSGVAGHTYSFYSVARDLVGNVEAAKTAAEASTQIVISAIPQIVATRTLSRDGQDNVVVTLTLTNTGGAAAQNTLVTVARIGATSATSIPTTPVNIAAGSSMIVTLVFPPSVGAPNTATTLTTGGTYVGGSFNFTSRITLP